MGGFFNSKHLEEMLQWFTESSHTDEYYEALEQCIVMTKVFEDQDINKFFEFTELLHPEIKDMKDIPMSVSSKIALAKFRRFSSEKSLPDGTSKYGSINRGEHNPLIEDER